MIWIQFDDIVTGRPALYDDEQEGHVLLTLTDSDQLLADTALPMIHGKRLIVVMPAYNAASTVEKTVADIPSGYLDEIVRVDDFSRNHSFETAKKMGLHATPYPPNRGYGGNQKTWYQEALKLGAGVVAMLHPDCQYTSKLVVAMASMIATGQYAASRIRRDLGRSAEACRSTSTSPIAPSREVSKDKHSFAHKV